MVDERDFGKAPRRCPAMSAPLRPRGTSFACRTCDQLEPTPGDKYITRFVRRMPIKSHSIFRCHAALPEFPTIAESGLAGYEASSWQGVVVPANTPRAIITKLHAEVALAPRSPDIGARLAAEGAEPGGTTPDEFAAYIRREIVKWAKVVRESGAKAD